MWPPPPIFLPCRCADTGRTHDERGLCSAIPPCCRQWFEVWIRSSAEFTKAQRATMVPVRWGYVPCPGCRQCGARVHVRNCPA